MTTVHVDANQLSGAGSGWGPITGSLLVTPLERHTVGDDLIVPAPFTATLDEAGEWTGVLVGGWIYRFEERVTGGTTRYALVPDEPGTVQYVDLPDVDPATLGPSPEAEAAWEVEAAARVAGDAALDGRLDSIEADYVVSADLDPLATDVDLAAEAAARVAADEDRIAGAAVSTDGSFSLPAPTGVGLEFVMADDGLDDIRWNGASL